MKYRKKPVIIDAEQFFGYEEFNGIHRIPGNMSNLGIYEDKTSPTGFSMNTLEGKHEVKVLDWIITGVKGEKYPCKPDIFEMTYEKVN